jgi:putative DNA primase/helicase
MPQHEQTQAQKEMMRMLEERVEEDKQRDKRNGNSGAQHFVLPSPALPMQVARQFIGTGFTFDDGKTLTLRHWRGGWWVWHTSHWQEADDRAMTSMLYRFTEEAVYLDDKENAKPWAPNRKRIGDLAEALSAICILPSNIDQPVWLDDRESDAIVATDNGLLDIERRRLYPHTPLFFNQIAVPFDYDASAKAPEQWLAFLAKLWPNEPDAIKVLGEWFGYVISGKLDLHKIFLMVGPTRGGKGVIARILTALVGKQNACGPTP